MKECLKCGTKTSNPKFCGRSCAASFNNTLKPKRQPESLCASCGMPNTKTRKYCKECFLRFMNERSTERWENCTLKEIKGKGSANAGGRYPYIRTLARKKYIESGKPMCCEECGYDKHVDIAHIKDIRHFDENTFVSEINDIDNLRALCKNHHWEFDNIHK